jgi:hypothetical protein
MDISWINKSAEVEAIISKLKAVLTAIAIVEYAT